MHRRFIAVDPRRTDLPAITNTPAQPAMLRTTILSLTLLCPVLAVAESGEADSDSGFVSLFDGQTLTGWTGATDGYEAEQGVLTCIQTKGGNLMTEKEYANFVLRLDFVCPEGGNNGVGLRVPKGGHASTDGFEIQVLDDEAEQYVKLQPYQYCGSVYGIIPAKRGHLKPAGEWNSMEISLIGRDIHVILNDVAIVDGNLDEASTPMTMDGKDHPGLKRTTGHIGFLGHGARVQYRNIRIKEVALPTDKADSAE